MRRTTLVSMFSTLALGVTGAFLVRSLPTSEAPGQHGERRLPMAGRAPSPHAQRFDDAALTRAVRTYMARRPGRAGVMVTDLRTGLSYGAWQGDRFVTASVIKVDILTALLLRRQREDRGLSVTERDRATEMIKVSDNDAADALYAEVGNGPGLRGLNRELGLRQTRPWPSVWGTSRTSAADQVRLMRALTDPESPLSASNRRYVLDLMYGVIGEQRWGISAAARPGERVAIKNGWVPLEHHGHGWAINTMGRITGRHHDFLIAVCSQSHPTMGTGVDTVEHLANLVVTAMRRGT
jgi:beta-lactamase class A